MSVCVSVFCLIRLKCADKGVCIRKNLVGAGLYFCVLLLIVSESELVAYFPPEVDSLARIRNLCFLKIPG